MERHQELTDHDFECQFRERTLPTSIFTHEAHLRLAWIHIRKYGIAQAKENIQGQLQHYVKYHGAEAKYNHTVTIAAILIVYHFIKKTQTDTFSQFILKHPELKSNFKGLIAFHYSFDIFKSKKARITYLEPDLLPFK
ncbi:MAG: hypothetical protein AB3N14_02725 [Flavobacteriaceae bacterium]